MPVIFLLSAIVSGIALLIVMYIVVMKLLDRPVDHACVSSLAKWLLAFLVLDVTMEGLEILSMAYESEESWEIVSQLIIQRIPISYLGIQLFLGSLIPLVILGALASTLSQARREMATGFAFLAAVLVLVGVFAMRWNVVIGGQLISKSTRGFLSYTPPLGGREGVLAAAAFMMLPFYLFYVITSLIPPWQRVVFEEDEGTPQEEGERQEALPAMGWASSSAELQSGVWSRGGR
jgi:predicted membrane protein